MVAVFIFLIMFSITAATSRKFNNFFKVIQDCKIMISTCNRSINSQIDNKIMLCQCNI